MNDDVFAILSASRGTRSLGDSYNQPRTPEPVGSPHRRHTHAAARPQFVARDDDADAHDADAHDAYAAERHARARHASPPRWGSAAPYPRGEPRALEPAYPYGDVVAPHASDWSDGDSVAARAHGDELASAEPTIGDKASLSLYIHQLTAKDVRLRAKLTTSLLKEIENSS
ncbi:hypothetical protein KFE25_001312 [Diacronema lutheri]|uniref:Uncharacterized protein n=1 Tax=Diacronema lutheri TaxID=2081491 RepID=A0A8J6C667_DIALT|nr:hypothetical protein KFE25_001312 [Diacronema lutheri]